MDTTPKPDLINLPPRRAQREFTSPVRWCLAGMVGGITLVFAIALWLRPYAHDGKPLLMGSHEQMGFPKCNFLVLTGMPCPSCGMTTSFALLVRGDLWNSLKANPVGTLLAGFLLALIPWSIACLMKGRFLLVRRVEIAMGLVLGVFITLALVRWAWIVAPHFWKW